MNRNEMFESLARIARNSDDKMDMRKALRFGIENKIPNSKIREFLSK